MMSAGSFSITGWTMKSLQLPPEPCTLPPLPPLPTKLPTLSPPAPSPPCALPVVGADPPAPLDVSLDVGSPLHAYAPRTAAPLSARYVNRFMPRPPVVGCQTKPGRCPRPGSTVPEGRLGAVSGGRSGVVGSAHS